MLALKFSALAALIAATLVAAAEPGQINQCKASDCTDCPTYLGLDAPGDADGLGILDAPQCTVYDGGFPDYPREDGGAAIVYHDVSQPDDGCAYVLRSPASVDDPACGFPIGVYRNAICSRNLVRNTYMWQRCCGQACDDAGISRRGLRGAGWFGGRSIEGSLTTLSVHNADGSRTAVHSSRPATYKAKMERRDCKGFNEERRYTTSGTPVLFGGSVQGPASVTKTDETSVSRTTSVSSSVGDPFGIVSVTVGFETTEEKSTSLSYMLEVDAGQLAVASWTPTLDCIEGTFTDCGDAPDERGSVCTPALGGNGEPQGVYSAVIQS